MKRRFKRFVLPSAFVIMFLILTLSVLLVGTTVNKKSNLPDMAVNAIIEDTIPVISNVNDDEIDIKIGKPWYSDKVVIGRSFYNMNDAEDKQKNSLVYYKNTYLQNSGVLYESEEAFDITSVLDGTVTNVSKDEILGNVVEISHNTNLKTLYYSLGEVNVKKDDSITNGAVIGKSGSNMLENQKQNCLLFEVYYKGNLIDPETIYTMNINELQ